MAIGLAETRVRPMGRGAAGVKGINLRSGVEVVSMIIIEEDTSSSCRDRKGCSVNGHSPLEPDHGREAVWVSFAIRSDRP